MAGCVGSCPRFSSEASDGPQCLVTGYFGAGDPPGVLTSIYKDPAEPGRQADSKELRGRKKLRKIEREREERERRAGPC